MKVRDNKFDFYKGILMLGVVWGHIITALKYGSSEPSWILSFFRTYDMPMFAFITGVFLRKSIQSHSTMENLCNKVGMILLPTLMWNIIFNLAIGRFEISFNEFWFLWATFTSTIIIIIIERLWRKIVVIQFVFLGVMIFLTHLGVLDKWNVGFLLFPCVFGYYYEIIKNRIKKVVGEKLFYLKLFLIVSFVFMQCFWTTDYNVWNTGCNIMAFDIPVKTGLIICYRGIMGIVGSIVMMMLFSVIYDILCRSNYPQMQNVVNGLMQVGKNTLEIYILQTILVSAYGATVVKKITEIFAYNIFTYNICVLDFIIAPAIAILSLWFMLYIIKLMDKIPYIHMFLWGIKINISKR